jgi:hypothetical protein
VCINVDDDDEIIMSRNFLLCYLHAKKKKENKLRFTAACNGIKIMRRGNDDDDDETFLFNAFRT